MAQTDTLREGPTIEGLVRSAAQTPEGLLAVAGLYKATIRLFRATNLGRTIYEADESLRTLEEVFPENHVLKVTQPEGHRLQVSLDDGDGPIGFERAFGRKITPDDAWYYDAEQVGTTGGREPMVILVSGREFPINIIPTYDENGIADYDLEIVPYTGQTNS